MNDGIKDREKIKYIIILWVFVFFWCKMVGKIDWIDYKIENLKYIVFL